MHKNSENWALEPDFKERFGRAMSWMRQHITDNQQQDSSAWLVMHMGFQCAVQELASAELNEVVGTLRRIKQMDWPGVLADKSLECTELVFTEDCYSVRVAPSHFAVVGRGGNRMFVLTLEHGSPSSI